MLELLKKGWLVVTKNSKLWLILWLVIVFPAVFIFTFTQLLSAGNYNVQTVELNRIATLHDMIEAMVVENFSLDNVMSSIKSEQKDIVKVQLVSENNEALTVDFDLEKEREGTTIDTKAPYRSALITPGETFIYEYKVGDHNVKQAFRAIPNAEKNIYIFTEHDFTALDSLMQKRVNQSYLILMLIFIFIIVLAYWIAQQINYQGLYKLSTEKLRERDLFTNSLAHELRAPLTAMRGYASMIEESTVTPQTERDYASKIKQSTGRLVNLVNDFLEAARIQSGQLAIKQEKTDLGIIIQKVITQSELLAKNKNLTLTKQLPPTINLIPSDEKRLEQILINIVSNSIKYTKQGNVSIILEQSAKKSVITVADTGFGISAEDQKKLFAPFVRVGDSTQMETTTGTGLGMWITRQLITQLGGTIEIESIKGVGTHVILSLPNNT